MEKDEFYNEALQSGLSKQTAEEFYKYCNKHNKPSNEQVTLRDFFEYKIAKGASTFADVGFSSEFQNRKGYLLETTSNGLLNWAIHFTRVFSYQLSNEEIKHVCNNSDSIIHRKKIDVQFIDDKCITKEEEEVVKNKKLYFGTDIIDGLNIARYGLRVSRGDRMADFSDNGAIYLVNDLQYAIDKSINKSYDDLACILVYTLPGEDDLKRFKIKTLETDDTWKEIVFSYRNMDSTNDYKIADDNNKYDMIIGPVSTGFIPKDSKDIKQRNPLVIQYALKTQSIGDKVETLLKCIMLIKKFNVM